MYIYTHTHIYTHIHICTRIHIYIYIYYDDAQLRSGGRFREPESANNSKNSSKCIIVAVIVTVIAVEIVVVPVIILILVRVRPSARPPDAIIYLLLLLQFLTRARHPCAGGHANLLCVAPIQEGGG